MYGGLNASWGEWRLKSLNEEKYMKAKCIKAQMLLGENEGLNAVFNSFNLVYYTIIHSHNTYQKRKVI